MVSVSIFTSVLILVLNFDLLKCALLNTDELEDNVYQVNIGDVPLGFNEEGVQIGDNEELPENTVLMTSQFGQKFVCTLPSPTKRKTETKVAYNEKEFPKSTIEEVISAGFYTNKCTKREFSWWTYEVCYGSVIKQYHVETSGAVTNTVSLGFFMKSMDVPSFTPKPDRPLYFEQLYANGTLCDLTGKPRTAVVRYYCEQLLETSDLFIYEVDESSTCEYVISIKSGSLCKLPPFLPVGQHQDPVDIQCRPWLQGSEALSYVKRRKDKAEKDKILLKKMELVYREGLSIRRQGYSLHHYGLREPRSAKKNSIMRERLRDRYKSLIEEMWLLNKKLSNSQRQAAKTFLLDEFYEPEESYTSYAGQERGEVYWYFCDPFWNKKYFPPTYGYITALNRFYDLKDNDNLLVSKVGERRDWYAYSSFLRQIDNGVITEADLSNLLGPLSVAFEESRIPTVENTLNLGIDASKIGGSGDAVYLALQKWVVEDRLKPFENRVIESLLNGDRFDPKTVMSKVARDLLSLRSLQERFYKLSNSDSSLAPAPYTTVEKIFKMYQEAYNRAIKRYDYEDYEVDANGDVVGISNSKVDNKKVKVDDISAKNAHFLYHDELDHELHEVFPTSESGAAWEEKMAQNRMITRAKRFNLRKLVERYFRKPDNDKLFEELYNNELRRRKKEEMKVLKALLENLQRNTGLTEDSELTVHLVTAEGEAVSASGDESLIKNLVKGWLEERATVSEEVDSHERMIKAYSFGASKQELEARKKASEPKQTDLPIIREFV